MGAGWVGLVTAACFAELGHNVFVRDIDEARIGALREGRVPIHEPGLPDLIHRYKDRLRFTLDANEVFAAATIVFVCVGTRRNVSARPAGFRPRDWSAGEPEDRVSKSSAFRQCAMRGWQ